MKFKQHFSVLLVALLCPFGCQEWTDTGSNERARYRSYASQLALTPTPYGGYDDHRGRTAGEFTNGGFETGDFSGWVVGDNGLSPLDPWQVCPEQSCGFFFNNDPIEGSFAALNGFDGDAGYEAFLFQDVEVPIQGGTVSLIDRIQFDSLGIPSTLPRIYEVQLRDTGDNILEILLHEEILLDGQPATDLGFQERVFDVSDYAGSTVRVYIRLFVPETLTGPAQFEIDDFRLEPGDGGGGGDTACDLAVEGVPNPASVGAPFVLEMDFANTGVGFAATVEVQLLADGELLPLGTEAGVPVQSGFAVTDFPIFSTLALDPLPPGVGFLVTVYDEATGGLACADVVVVGINGALTTSQSQDLESLATEYLATPGFAAMGAAEPALHGTVRLPFGIVIE